MDSSRTSIPPPHRPGHPGQKIAAEKDQQDLVFVFNSLFVKERAVEVVKMTNEDKCICEFVHFCIFCIFVSVKSMGEEQRR